MADPGTHRPSTPARTGSSWDGAYRDGAAPWDTGRPSTELARTLEEEGVPAA